MLNCIDEASYHFSLWTFGEIVNTIVCLGIIVGLELREVWVAPYSYLSLLAEEYHVFSDIKSSIILVEHFEALKTCSVKIDLILERNVVDLLEPQINFVHEQLALIVGGTELILGGIS